MHLNTAISALMELVNELYAFTDRPRRRAGAVAAQARGDVRRREAIEALVLMLSPFAPHTAEELWERYGHAGGLAAAAWPAFDDDGGRGPRDRRAGAGQRQGARPADRAAGRTDEASSSGWRSPIRPSSRTCRQDHREGGRGQGRLVSVVVA